MISFEAERLHGSDAVRRAQADALARTFDLYLRAASPALANAWKAAVQDPAAVVTAAILAIADQTDASAAVGTFDAVRQSGRGGPRNDAILGHALVAALAEVLGPAFDEPAREAWANGYIRLVESVMARRRNRMDFVA